jgi:translation initiation factor 6 (eIF-6)
MRETWRWLRAKLRGYWYLRGVIDELKSREAISSFMQASPARADLGERENVGGAGESTNKGACIKVILS